MSDQEYIEKIAKEIVDIVKKKNTDYDHAFDKAFKRIGQMYAAGKIYEKTERIITLSGQEACVEDEGLDDALRDNIGYSLLYLNARRKQQKK